MGYAHGIRWTEDLIKEQLLEVVDKLKLDRMPSKSELDEYYGNCGLSMAIGKRGGLYHYANIYGLQIKKSESQFGLEYEKHVRDTLISFGYDVETTIARHPYDLIVNGRVKLDVKAGRIVKTGCADYYTFNLEKPKQTCDIYIAITLNKDDSINKIYVIPASVMYGKCQLSLGINKSKYDKYIDRWDLIEKIDLAFEELEAS